MALTSVLMFREEKQREGNEWRNWKWGLQRGRSREEAVGDLVGNAGLKRII